MHERLHIGGVEPELWVLDNQTSNLLKKAMETNGTTYQLWPPHIHRTNLAEIVEQTFKNRLKAGLDSFDPDFPMSEWDHLVEESEFILNLFRAED